MGPRGPPGPSGAPVSISSATLHHHVTDHQNQIVNVGPCRQQTPHTFLCHLHQQGPQGFQGSPGEAGEPGPSVSAFVPVTSNSVFMLFQSKFH